VVQHAEGLDARVVTLSHAQAHAFDAAFGFDVRRVPSARFGHRASIARLNAAAVAEGLRFRPDVVLSGHIVMSPAAAAIRRILGAPMAQYLHGYELVTRPRLTRFAVRRADASIAVSRSTRDTAIAAGASPDLVHVIPVGVDSPRAEESERESVPTVLTVGRLRERYKGHDTMLSALPLLVERVPDVRWVVVGDGPLRAEFETLAAGHGVQERVVFAGEVSDAERDAWFRRAHVFAMPARTPAAGIGEGFGIVFLEANAHGIPVVAGGVDGALDAVVDGVTGTLVEPTNPVAVADAVADLLLDPERARRLGAAGAERARRDFSWPAIATRVETLLRSIAKRSG
jgi:phosphatidylinositol alpha-1,6-mannosyltransferase